MTTNENRFNTIVKEAMDKYNAALEAKSIQNKVKHASITIEKMKKALELADIISRNDKIPYIWEYICLSQALIGQAYYDAKDFKEAIPWLKSARESNKKTLDNQETIIRELYLLEKLMNVAVMQLNWRIADDFAQQFLPYIKRYTDDEKKTEYLLKIKEVFIQSKNLDMIQKTYNELEKTCKHAEGDFRKAKVLVWLDYAKYLEIVLKKKRQARNFYQEAATLLHELKRDEEAEKIEAKVAELK